MFPCERYLGILKSYVRSRSHPEASMANGYVAEEALGFCMEYLNLQTYTKRNVWDSEEDKGMHGCVVEGRGRMFNLTEAEMQRTHSYVVLHHERTLEMRRYAFSGHDFQESAYISVVCLYQTLCVGCAGSMRGNR